MAGNLLSFALMSLIWGTTWAAVKFGLQEVPPLFLAAMRYLSTAIVLSVALGGGAWARMRDQAARIVGSAILPFAAWLVSHAPVPVIAAAAIAGAFVIWRHKENITRLRAGREHTPDQDCDRDRECGNKPADNPERELTGGGHARSGSDGARPKSSRSLIGEIRRSQHANTTARGGKRARRVAAL